MSSSPPTMSVCMSTLCAIAVALCRVDLTGGANHMIPERQKKPRYRNPSVARPSWYGNYPSPGSSALRSSLQRGLPLSGFPAANWSSVSRRIPWSPLAAQKNKQPALRSRLHHWLPAAQVPTLERRLIASTAPTAMANLLCLRLHYIPEWARNQVLTVVFRDVMVKMWLRQLPHTIALWVLRSNLRLSKR